MKLKVDIEKFEQLVQRGENIGVNVEDKLRELRGELGKAKKLQDKLQKIDSWTYEILKVVTGEIEELSLTFAETFEVLDKYERAQDN